LNKKSQLEFFLCILFPIARAVDFREGRKGRHGKGWRKVEPLSSGRDGEACNTYREKVRLWGDENIKTVRENA
jgi:hypothetical protein